METQVKCKGKRRYASADCTGCGHLKWHDPERCENDKATSCLECLPEDVADAAADHDQRNDEAAAKWQAEAGATDLDITIDGGTWCQCSRTLNHESAVRIAEKDALESDHEEVIIVSTVKGHALGPVDSHTVYYR